VAPTGNLMLSRVGVEETAIELAHSPRLRSESGLAAGHDAVVELKRTVRPV
jgi:hypothetical protein